MDIEKILRQARKEALRNAIDLEAKRLALLAMKDHAVQLDFDRSLADLKQLCEALVKELGE